MAEGLYYWRVRASNYNDEPGPWSEVRSIGIKTTPPLPPVLNTPLNDTIVRVNPTFRWFASEFTFSYKVAYDNDSDCTSPIFTSGPLVSTLIYTPYPAMDRGDYYWCVKAGDGIGNWSAWSSSRKLHYHMPIPEAPHLRNPQIGLVTQDTTPDFSWDGFTTAHYEIQIDNQITFADPIEQTSTISGGTYTSLPLTDGLKFWRVRAINSDGEPGAWSAIRNIIIDTTAPLPPVLNWPVNNAAGIRATPTFSWLKSVEANAYQFQYDEAENFADPFYTSDVLTVNTHKPTSDMGLGTWYWRVMARDAVGNWSSWSPYRAITILPLIPAAPVLLSPATASFSNDITPDFTWNPVSGDGITYQIQIDNLPTFASPIEADQNELGTSFTAPDLTEGLKYWRVRAINATNEPGLWSQLRTLTIDTTVPVQPVLNLPLNNAPGIRSTPTFSWRAAVGVNAYQFQYDEAEDFADPFYTSGVLAITTHKPTPNMELGTWYWRVMARDAAGNWSNWSLYRTITILPLIPAAPVLANPTTASFTNDITPDFGWNPVPGSGITYQIQIDNLATFAAPIEADQNGLGTTFTSPDLTQGLKYWRVRAYNATNEPGPWSLLRILTIDTTSPPPPILKLPANSTSVRGTPTFSWLASAGAKTYQFQYDDTEDFADPFYTSGVLNITTHKPTPNVGLGTWYWRVMACDAAGNWSDWSAYQTVTILPLIPVAPVLISPATASFTNDITPDFAWNAITGEGITYQIQIDNLTTFAAPIEVQQSGLVTTSFTSTDLTQGMKFWRVRAYNPNSEPGPWSPFRSFTIDTTPPLPPVFNLPANEASNPGTPTFSWLASTGAKAYQFQYDEVEDFVDPVYTSGVLSITTHKPTPNMRLGTWYWRVIARDAAGNWSAWSASRILTILPTIPTVPILVSPVIGGITNDVSPDFAWNPITEEGTTYQIPDRQPGKLCSANRC